MRGCFAADEAHCLGHWWICSPSIDRDKGGARQHCGSKDWGSCWAGSCSATHVLLLHLLHPPLTRRLRGRWLSRRRSNEPPLQHHECNYRPPTTSPHLLTPPPTSSHQALERSVAEQDKEQRASAAGANEHHRSLALKLVQVRACEHCTFLVAMHCAVTIVQLCFGS